MPVRIMVVERYRFVRDAMRVAIARAPDLDLVADAGDVVEAIGLAMDHEPDVIVLDVDWPSLQGLAAAPCLRKAVPGACIVMYSSDPDFETDPELEAAHAAIAGGADAYLAASSTLEEMMALLQSVPISTAGSALCERELAAG